MIQDVIYYWRGLYNHGYDGPRPHDFLIERPAYIFVHDEYYDIENNTLPLKTVLEKSPAAKDSLIFFLNHSNPQLDFGDYNVHSMIYSGLSGIINVGTDVRKGPFIDEVELNFYNKTQPFNFIVNKPRIQRIVLLLLLEHFKLNTESYSFTWPTTSFDCAAIENLIKSSTLLDKDKVDWSTISLKAKAFQTSEDHYCGNFLIERDSGLKNIYRDHLKNIYRDSFVSLIQEPNFETFASQFTEKTLFPVANQNLMIWAGGYQQASEFEALGFDIFRDIVDHSYEKHTDLVSRIFYAIKNNLHLLQDTKISKKFYKENHSRFLSNAEKILNFWPSTQHLFKEFLPITDLTHREIQMTLAQQVISGNWHNFRHVREFHKTGYQVTPIHRLLDP